MPSYIKNPIKADKWDPSKGDFFSKSIHDEDLKAKRKAARKKALIALLTISHILLFILVLALY